MTIPSQTTIDEVKARIRPILLRHGVIRSSVFGSLVRGELTPSSDIDILIELESPISLFAFAGLQRELEEALGRRVDLGEYAALKPRVRDQVLSEQVPIL